MASCWSWCPFETHLEVCRCVACGVSEARRVFTNRIVQLGSIPRKHLKLDFVYKLPRGNALKVISLIKDNQSFRGKCVELSLSLSLWMLRLEVRSNMPLRRRMNGHFYVTQRDTAHPSLFGQPVWSTVHAHNKYAVAHAELADLQQLPSQAIFAIPHQR